MKTTPDSWIERNDMADEPGPPDPEDACMVCNKLECECPPEDLEAETPTAIDQTPNETDCEQCDGKGWYAWGETDNPEQRQCESCLGTGVISPEELGATDEHVKRMITFGEMWHRKKLTPKELADAITKAKQDHPEDFPK